jgi:hypothetical protein
MKHPVREFVEHVGWVFLALACFGLAMTFGTICIAAAFFDSFSPQALAVHAGVMLGAGLVASIFLCATGACLLRFFDV